MEKFIQAEEYDSFLPLSKSWIWMGQNRTILEEEKVLVIGDRNKKKKPERLNVLMGASFLWEPNMR